MADRPFRTVLVPPGRTSVSRRLLRRAVLTVIAERKSEYKKPPSGPTTSPPRSGARARRNLVRVADLVRDAATPASRSSADIIADRDHACA